ncbi:MAG: glycoside hydrolase family 10 protein [Acetanaerobacterium sp.]
MKKLSRVLLLMAVLPMFASCAYNLSLGQSSSVGDEVSSSKGSSSSDSYLPEQPAYNSEVAFDGVDSGTTVSDVFEAIDSASSQVSSQASSQASSSKASSSKEPSSSAPPAASSSREQIPVLQTKAPSQEMSAVWISYLDLETMLKGKNASGAKAAIDSAFDNVVGLSMNTVIVQVRPFADALYDSDYFPWSRILTGTQGKDPGYDPLQIMVSSAHARGLEIHVWINPYRVITSTNYSKLVSGHIAREWHDEGNDYTVPVDSTGIFFNPARKEVRELVINGVAELVSGYDIDGVHYDDYFYPTTATSFDKKAYGEYTAGGGAKSLSSWRMDNVNKLISGTYSAIKAIDPSVQFGVSPNGNIDLNYSSLYADVKTWCKSTGYVDYIMPQLYYGFENGTCPYEDTLKAWNGLISASGVKLYAGLAVYKIGTADQWAGAGAQEWLDSSTMMRRQVSSAREYSKYGGFALYRYDSVFNPSSSVSARVAEEIKNLQKIL